jgi:hypothetical protein
MEMDEIFHNAGAALTFLLGVMAVVRPQLAARLTSIEPRGALGLSELRATHGGLLAALGGFALLAQAQVVFTAVGLAWAGAAAARTLSLAVDHSFSGRSLGAVVFDTAIAALLLAPSPPVA